MKLKIFSICCFIPFFLLGCGIKLDSISSGGVSLGGTGLPATSGTPTIPINLGGLPGDIKIVALASKTTKNQIGNQTFNSLIEIKRFDSFSM